MSAAAPPDDRPSRDPSGDARRLPRTLAPTDRAHVAFGAVVLLVAVARLGALPSPTGVVAWYAASVLAAWVLARAVRGAAPWTATMARTAFACLAVPVSFLMLGGIVPYANPWHAERLLKAVDDALFFGVNPNVAIDRLATPWVTEILQIDYACYYAIPVVMIVALVRARKREGVDRCLFLAVLCLYVSYLGYFLVPATGPNLNRFGLYPPHFGDPMPGTWIAERLRAALLEAEAIKHDCFPSGHAALSITCLALAWRERLRGAFLLLLPVVLALVVSTVYLRYHYVVDVLGGFVLAWAVLRYGPGLYERLGGGVAGGGAAGGSHTTRPPGRK